MTEQGADDPRRLVSDRVWIVDPLDGTRECRPDLAAIVIALCREFG